MDAGLSSTADDLTILISSVSCAHKWSVGQTSNRSDKATRIRADKNVQDLQAGRYKPYGQG